MSDVAKRVRDLRAVRDHMAAIPQAVLEHAVTHGLDDERSRLVLVMDEAVELYDRLILRPAVDQLERRFLDIIRPE